MSPDIAVSFKLKGKKGKIQVAGNTFTAKKNTTTDGILIIDIPPSELTDFNNKIIIEVWSGDELLETVRTGFFKKPD